MLVAITNEGKVGLGLVTALFILFALAVSFWFPRRNPDFPGERLGAFIGVAVALFVATVAGVVVFAKEEEGAAGHEAAETHAVTDTGGAETQPTETGGGSDTGGTDTGGTDTGGETGGGEDGHQGGDAEAGAEVYEANGCGTCHTFEAAGSSGQVGPNLDEAEPSVEEAVEVVTNGRGAMPAFGDRLDEQQIRDVAAYVAGE